MNVSAVFRHCGWLVLAAVLLCLARQASADTEITLFKSFAGNVNFVGTQKTLRTKANAVDPCAVASSSTTTTAALSGIPTGATILSAQLYWAGSGSSSARDYSIVFEGFPVVATTARQYSSATVGYDFFGGAADVTSQVTSKRNGTYSFSGLAVSTGSPYCSVQAVLGGWSLVVVYSLKTETFRVLNIYEGFKYIRSSSITLTLSNFTVPALTSTMTGRVAHVTWEGDSTISGGGEDLSFNGYAMTDTLNPSGNQFNSASNINNDAASYGVDFDAYTLASPKIQAGQTSATTEYESGTDLVLLNAEIIAVPNTPIADLAITMTRDQDLILGQSALYTLNVTNNGPQDSSTPIVVTDTVPVTLGVLAAGGEDWTCVISGQVVTCTYAAELAVGTTAPPVYLLTMVNSNSASSVTNTASVDGPLFDNISSNNSASNTGTISVPTYVFTDSACVNATAFGNSRQTCKFLTLAKTIAGVPIKPIYVTNLNTSGVPTALSTTLPTIKSIRFGLSCQNPVKDAGTYANFPDSLNTLPLCTPSSATPTTWGTYQLLTFPASSPSNNVGMSFDYADAGRVKLFMYESASRIGASGPFIMRPDNFVLTASRTVGSTTVQNPAPTTAAAGTATVFAHAGDYFTIKVQATTRKADPSDSSKVLLAKNYGNEISDDGSKAAAPHGVTLAVQAAADPASTTTPKATFADMTNMPDLVGQPGGFSAGVSSYDQFVWDEVGILAITPNATGGDYLGAGAVTGVSVNIGRFVPDHFDTTIPVASPLMSCSSALTCASTLSGMVYSVEPFGATVTARHLNGTALQNYKGAFARPVTLTAFSTLGGAVANPPSATGKLYLGSATAAAVFTADLFAAGTGVAAANINYALPNPYSRTNASTAANPGAPTAFYLRATDPDAVTSLRSTTATTVEGGVMVASGRMVVANANGSELLTLPLGLTAQYWSGSAWVLSDSDSVSSLSSSNFSFQNCKANLKTTATGTSNCSTLVAASTSPASVVLSAGTGTLRLNATGKGKTGSAEVFLSSPAWLPSTVGLATFGVYKSGPVTYIREVY
jgi:MSHA biogenesis protein MshQ